MAIAEYIPILGKEGAFRTAIAPVDVGRAGKRSLLRDSHQQQRRSPVLSKSVQLQLLCAPSTLHPLHPLAVAEMRSLETVYRPHAHLECLHILRTQFVKKRLNKN